jgi:hypothetical protein
MNNVQLDHLVHTLEEESEKLRNALCVSIENSTHIPYSPDQIERYLSKLVSSTDAVCDELENINSSIRELNKTVEASIVLLVKTLQK